MDPTPEQVSTFGTAAREHRRAKQLSAEHVAGALSEILGRDVKHQSVTAWERGEYGPQDYATAKALDDVLGCGGQLVALLYADPPNIDEVKELREEVDRLRRIVERLDKSVGASRGDPEDG